MSRIKMRLVFARDRRGQPSRINAPGTGHLPRLTAACAVPDDI